MHPLFRQGVQGDNDCMKCNVTGKTIIPFNTHAGSRDGGTYGDIKELEPNATVLEGLAVRGEDAGKDSTKEAVLSWLEGLDLE